MKLLQDDLFNLPVSIPYLLKHFGPISRGFKNRLVDEVPYAFSFNISESCPIDCDCYWRAKGAVTALPDEEVIQFFQEKRKEGYVLANIVGGEPYVRVKLLEEVVKILPFNWLVTSGVTPLRPLVQTTQFVSIDGADGETHNSIRRVGGNKGLYARVCENVERAAQEGIAPLIIHTVLNRENYTQACDIVSQWYESGMVEGILFSTLTPMKQGGDEHLRLTYEQRVHIVDELLALRREFGDFVKSDEDMISRFHPEHTKHQTPETCHAAQWVPSYDGAGDRIPQCILGAGADCSQCGCTVTTMSDGTGKGMSEAFERMTSIRNPAPWGAHKQVGGKA